MRSTGNDIIDLRAARLDGCDRPEFHTKILGPDEHARPLPAGLSFGVWLWLCWSAKESAFKFLQRLEPELRFSPTRIAVGEALPMGGGRYAGTVRIRDRALLFRSQVTGESIHTQVSDCDDFDTLTVLTGEADPGRLSEGVRRLATGALSARMPSVRFEITTTETGVPMLSEDGAPSARVISLSHHGRYVAAVIRDPE